MVRQTHVPSLVDEQIPNALESAKRFRNRLGLIPPSEDSAMNRNTPSLCFIGFGEAGQAIASGLRDSGIASIAAWDILFPAAEGSKLKQAGESIGARVAGSAAEAARGADIVISAVTAASSLEAAMSVAPHLTGNPYFLDINSM